MSITAPRACRPGRPGFTLTEMMIAVSVSVLLVAALVTTFVFHRRSYFAQSSVNDMNQNLRAAMDILTRDLRMAGYGITCPASQMATWLDWGGYAMTSPLTIVQGATSNQPDRVLVAAAFGETTATLGSPVRPGDLSLSVTAGDGAKFNDRDRKMIFIGGLEMARIVAVSGDRLTISTHPVRTDGSLRHNHPNGTSVELVQIISYHCQSDPSTGAYYLHREVTGSGLPARSKILSFGMDNLQLTSLAGAVTVDLSARTDRPDPKYRHPTQRDGYRRAALRSVVTVRNPW